MLIAKKITEFIDEVDSKSPAPGGGSVAALSAALGVSLTRMVGHLSIDKKRFLALDSNIQFEFKDVISSLTYVKTQLIQAIDDDTKSFNMIMQAYQMPKTTDQEKELRQKMIQEGTVQAILVPMKVATLSLTALHQIPFIMRYGNPQTVSDLGVAILSLASGALGACMNVYINLPSLDDHIAKHQYKIQADDLKEKIEKIQTELLKEVYERLKINE
ncbi:MAG: formimidoyltetrahydrofolate cyclodeaminase [Acholeplasma sp.]|jgi:formiminotetrahydrofolate cyclodeaminase|nr:MAG: formimidoyltetrahydrofolate cyclodeaminase [Acholeplasma sp.]